MRTIYYILILFTTSYVLGNFVFAQDSLLIELKKVDAYIDTDRGAAEEAIERIRFQARRDVNKTVVARSFLTKGNLYFQYQEFDLALIEYENALQLFLELKDTTRIQSAYNNIGAVYTVKEDYLNSLENYLKGYSYVKEGASFDHQNNNVERIKNYLIILINLGSTYYDMQDYKNAKSFYSKVVEGSEKIQDSSLLEKSLYDLSSSELELGELEVAKEHLLTSIQVEQASKSSRGLALKYASLAKLEYKMKNASEAQRYLSKSKLELEKGEVLNWDEISLLNDLSELESYFSFYGESIKYAQRAYDLSLELKLDDDRIRSLKNLSHAYSKSNQFEKAYETQQELFELNEKKNSNMTSLDVARVEMKLNYEKRMLLDSLESLEQKSKKEKEILEVNAENRNRMWVILILSGLMVLLIVGLFTLYGFNKKRAKNNQLLKKSLAEKEVLLKEVHHRVKNNFQVISSLLNLQLGTNPENVEDALKIAQDRIQSMALVHRKLYGQEDFEAIEMGEYIQELIETIVDSNAITSTYAVDINATGKYVKLDQAIPLGLIFNELVTNYFKYVVPHTENPILRISIEENVNELIILVSDNGGGLPENVNLENISTLGLELVQILSEQINATLDLKSSKDGVQVELKIPIDVK